MELNVSIFRVVGERHASVNTERLTVVEMKVSALCYTAGNIKFLFNR